MTFSLLWRVPLKILNFVLPTIPERIVAAMIILMLVWAAMGCPS